MMRTCLNKILVCQEKHGTYYYDVSDQEKMHKVCCAVLKTRLDEGWYGDYEKPVSRIGIKSRKDIDKLPEGVVKETALDMWKEYQDELSSYNEIKKFKKRVEKIIALKWNDADSWRVCGLGEEKSHSRAFDLLLEHYDYEYEKCTVENVGIVK